MSGIPVSWADALLRASLEGGLAVSCVYLLSVPLRTRAPRAVVWLWRLVFVKLFMSLAVIGIPVLTLASGPMERIAGGSSTADPLPLIILAATLAGCAARIARFVFQMRWVDTLTFSASPVECPRTRDRLNLLCARFGLSSSPLLLTSPLACGPVLVGIRQPAIILPEGLPDRLSEVELDAVLCHELEHIRSRDLCWGWLSLCADILFFFHPLVHVAQRQLAAAQEIACDHTALSTTALPRASYARVLLALSSGQGRTATAHAGLMAMSGTYHLLELRFRALSRGSEARPVYRLAGGAALCGAIPVLALTFSAAAPSEDPAPPLREGVFSPARPLPSPASARLAAPMSAAAAAPIRFSGERLPRTVGPRSRPIPREVRR